MAVNIVLMVHMKTITIKEEKQTILTANQNTIFYLLFSGAEEVNSPKTFLLTGLEH